MLGADDVLRPQDDLHVETFDDGLLMWDERSESLHHLESVGALVWQDLDGRSLGEVADALAAEFGAEPSTVRADVVTLGQRLLTEGLVTRAIRSTTHAIGRESPGSSAP
jgi:hypothetical protein